MNSIRIVFMGTPEFSVPILKLLIDNYNVVGVVTQPDRFVGRKKVLTPSPVKKVAIDNNIKVLTPNKLRLEYEDVISLNPDMIVTCAFGQIVPKEILDYPKYGCINVHGSLLPKYRGGAPIQRAIMNGDKVTGITIMYMNEGLDTGDMIEKDEVLIDVKDNYETLSNKLIKCATGLLERVIPKILSGENNREKQDDNLAVYAPIITREDEKIDFNTNTVDIYNRIRALSPIPGAYTILDGKVLKIYDSVIGSEKNSSNPGKIINVYENGIGISTEDGEIIITDIKLEGKNRTSVKNFLNGIKKENMIGKGLGD